MTSLRSIEIDFDVHQKIELARKSFDESSNDALRRLLGLPEKSKGVVSEPQAIKGRDWSWKGVTLPHGTELQMQYNGRVHKGMIDDGKWSVEGKTANSPSEAARLVAQTKDGESPSLNGWVYWHFKRNGERSWKPLQSLKKK